MKIRRSSKVNVLRLNLFEEDLGYRFDVHRTTVLRIFRRVLYVLAVKTKDLILWPDRVTLRLTMPTAFRSSLGNYYYRLH